MGHITQSELYQWCKIPYWELEGHPDLKIPFRLCKDSTEMGQIMARELVEEIQAHNRLGQPTYVILPCGPSCWYRPFTDMVNRERVNLNRLVVFHMDECLDWQGRELPKGHPLNFRHCMEQEFYQPVDEDLAVPLENRHFLNATNYEQIRSLIASVEIDICFGGWGQDGHMAYNQARRHPYSQVTIEELRNSTVRIQENNYDTILALAQRNFGSAYQFVPPMAVTLGLKEVLSAKKVRLFSDTGAWKQTALRVGLFGPMTTEYPITLLQTHPDALITATIETARHPISEHLEWDLGVNDSR